MNNITKINEGKNDIKFFIDTAEMNIYETEACKSVIGFIYIVNIYTRYYINFLQYNLNFCIITNNLINSSINKINKGNVRIISTLCDTTKPPIPYSLW